MGGVDQFDQNVSNLRFSFTVKYSASLYLPSELILHVKMHSKFIEPVAMIKKTYCDFRTFRNQQIITYKVPLLEVQELKR